MEDAAARENSIYFTVNRTTGRLELRPSAFPALMAFKERAAILGPWMLAAVPADVDHHQYLLIDRHTGAGRMLDAAPDATDGEIKKAYRALVREYHPDIIKSQGASDDYLKEATEKVQEINAAYEMIKKSRGM